MPASAAAPSGSRLVRRPIFGHALGIARKHLDIGQQVVAEADRLRHLQVGEAGHDDVGIGVGGLDQRALQFGQQAADRADLVAQPQPHVGRDLVVARAAGVQPLAGVADQLRQPGLDIQVHVFEVELPLEAGRLRSPARICARPRSDRREVVGG